MSAAAKRPRACAAAALLSFALFASASAGAQPVVGDPPAGGLGLNLAIGTFDGFIGDPVWVSSQVEGNPAGRGDLIEATRPSAMLDVDLTPYFRLGVEAGVLRWQGATHEALGLSSSTAFELGLSPSLHVNSGDADWFARLRVAGALSSLATDSASARLREDAALGPGFAWGWGLGVALPGGPEVALVLEVGQSFYYLHNELTVRSLVDGRRESRGIQHTLAAFGVSAGLRLPL